MPGSKQALRKDMLQMRNGLSSAYINECSEQICRALIQFPVYREAESVLFYMAFRNEADVRRGMEDAWKQGKQVLLPRANPADRSMRCFRVDSFAELEAGAYGISEPPDDPGREVDPERIQLVIVPGVAFDVNGYRLGYGGGYYDRFFAGFSTRSKRIGVAYPEQIVKTVYPDPHDQAMDWIITPHEVFTIHQPLL
ncbi:5-formyltetrahydrofolate cyclo-ligase [Paenactinomyces guangxiensis]|uniref:5-formyltetrahydrofolate cyclo-ligase n=1 Tax=Paenactinomyces guangxiensis TaxID=1490290 RepID=A0A7W1WT33_9BACL|nr:5-formyltetrahydrofolate cyclo-ligase [Paenactinomyces guangxiensis]MBA4495578.1 5-formyltetrahydrofolate cyclo-ligase [Paenactinomyces guangxiensis]MBH8592836.1 5-formyltetrahydrofolate cyclo-ligase [Paenactinomyces guangxiensis]